MAKYKGKKYDPNYKDKKRQSEREVFNQLRAAASGENLREPEYGKRTKPHVGMLLNEEYGFVNLLNILDSQTEFTHDDAELIEADPIVLSYREKLLGSASAQKSSYDLQGVADDVTDFANELKNTLDWDYYHRAAYSASKYGNAVIQVLWENVQYEIIGDKVYPKTQRIYGFKQEDYRSFNFNTDKTIGNYGDTIYTPERINITKLYPNNFVVIRNKPNFLYPEGVSDLKTLKNLILLKNFLIKTQARYIKKATVPSFVAIYKDSQKEPGLSLKAIEISSRLSGVESGAGIGMANIDQIVSLMPTAQTDFIRILSYIDSVIQLKILGTSLLGGQMEKGGSYASAKVGATELENAIKQVALTLQNVDNMIIKLAIWQRFGTATILPKLLFDLTETAPLEDFEFQAKYKVPCSYSAIAKRFNLAEGATEPTDKRWFLGSPDGTLENLIPEGALPKPILTEEERLAEDAKRKQDEEADKLKKKEI